jgi:succinyl-diaminopimelate desuccinylase
MEAKIKEDIISLTEALIRFRSDKDSQDERNKAIKFIEDYCRKHGKAKLSAEILESSGIKTLYIWNPDAKIRKLPELMLCGHVDVIAAAPDDFKPRHDSKYIYGRGSGDMKSGLAIAMDLMCRYSDRKNVSLLVTTDEETGGFNGAKVAAEKHKPAIMLLSEPTEGKLVLKEKGATWVDIKVEGPGGHASRPWLARNAVDILYEVITELRQHFKTAEKEGWVDTLTIGAIQGGNLDIKDGAIVNGAGNVIAKKACARLDIRLTEKTSHDKAYKIIDDCLTRKGKALGEGYKVSKEIITRVEHLDTKEDNPMVKRFCDIYEKGFGKPELGKEHGASDGRFFSAKGVPVILVGPVSIGHHSTDEKVELDSVVKAYDVLDNYLKNV